MAYRTLENRIRDVVAQKTEKAEYNALENSIRKILFNTEAVVISHKAPIGTKVADIGPGNKEHNVKTDKRYDTLSSLLQKKQDEKVKKEEVEVSEKKDPREYDYEGDMAKSQLRSIIANAQTIHDMLKDDTNMAEWVQSKITLAADYISTVRDYITSETNEEVQRIEEISKATAQSYTNKVVDPVMGIPRPTDKLAKRMKGLAAAHKRISGQVKTSEAVEQIDEISAETKASYVEKATKQVKELKPHAKKGEYRDIAKRMIARRKKGMAMAEEAIEMDPNDQVSVGSYKTKHFDYSPEAQKLFSNLPKNIDPNKSEQSAVLHDKLFALMKLVSVQNGSSREEHDQAKQMVDRINMLGADLHLKHPYLDKHLKHISSLTNNKKDASKTLPKSPTGDLTKDSDVDQKSFAISRAAKMQRKIKIIDDD